VPRRQPAVLPLPQGQVLVAGGGNRVGDHLPSTASAQAFGTK
jgi:hypothetical protein